MQSSLSRGAGCGVRAFKWGWRGKRADSFFRDVDMGSTESLPTGCTSHTAIKTRCWQQGRGWLWHGMKGAEARDSESKRRWGVPTSTPCRGESGEGKALQVSHSQRFDQEDLFSSLGDLAWLHPFSIAPPAAPRKLGTWPRPAPLLSLAAQCPKKTRQPRPQRNPRAPFFCNA